MLASVLMEFATPAIIGVLGFLSAISLRWLRHWRLGHVFGGLEKGVVRVVLSVWEVAPRADGSRVMEKTSELYGNELVNYLGDAEMTARPDVAGMAMVVDTISRVAGVSAQAGFDSDSLDIEQPTVLIGSPTSNDASRHLMETMEEVGLRMPLTISVNRADPDSLVFTSTKSGKSYSSNEQYEFAIVARYKNPFGHGKNKKTIMIAGQFANGTLVASQFFSSYWRRLFRFGRHGAVLQVPHGQKAPVRVVEYLR